MATRKSNIDYAGKKTYIANILPQVGICSQTHNLCWYDIICQEQQGIKYYEIK